MPLSASKRLKAIGYHHPEYSPLSSLTHAFTELTENRNHPLRHTEAGKHCPQKCSVDGVERFEEIVICSSERMSTS